MSLTLVLSSKEDIGGVSFMLNSYVIHELLKHVGHEREESCECEVEFCEGMWTVHLRSISAACFFLHWIFSFLIVQEFGKKQMIYISHKQAASILHNSINNLVENYENRKRHCSSVLQQKNVIVVLHDIQSVVQVHIIGSV